MAQNDMHVVMYKILSYIYKCMKEGVEPDASKLSSSALSIPEEYWKQIVRELVEHGYLTGVSTTQVTTGLVVDFAKPRVTMDGVEFLMENSMMSKAKQFLIEAKSTIPFI